MALNKGILEQLDKAVDEYYEKGAITTPCPYCGGRLELDEKETGYILRCIDESKTLEIARGI